MAWVPSPKRERVMMAVVGADGRWFQRWSKRRAPVNAIRPSVRASFLLLACRRSNRRAAALYLSCAEYFRAFSPETFLPPSPLVSYPVALPCLVFLDHLHQQQHEDGWKWLSLCCRQSSGREALSACQTNIFLSSPGHRWRCHQFFWPLFDDFFGNFSEIMFISC